MSGESDFSTELLSEVIQKQEQRCSELRGKVYATRKESEDGETTISSMSAKRMIVSRMIDRVDVCRGYQLKLKLNISVEHFWSFWKTPDWQRKIENGR